MGKTAIIETSPYLKQVNELILKEDASAGTIMEWLKERGVKISRQAVANYKRELLKKIKERSAEMSEELIEQGAIENVNVMGFLKDVVKQAQDNITKNGGNISLKEAIAAAKVLKDNDRTVEFTFVIQGNGDYELVAKALEMMSDESKREFVKIIDGLRNEAGTDNTE